MPNMYCRNSLEREVLLLGRPQSYSHEYTDQKAYNISTRHVDEKTHSYQFANPHARLLRIPLLFISLR
jgi:hypothetical protein